MIANSIPREVLEEYARNAREYGPRQAEATILRGNSLQAKEILAYLASGGTMTASQILTDGPNYDALDPRWAAALARVCLVQDDAPQNDHLLRNMLETALMGLPRSHASLRYRALLAEAQLDAGEDEKVEFALNEDAELSDFQFGYLGADLVNPWRRGRPGDEDLWLELFNVPFRTLALPTLTLGPNPDAPFDRITVGDVPSVDGPLVSVIVTTFRPESAALRTAVRSILDQTWSNLEVVVVDDGSPPEYDSVLAEVAAMDSRVRLHRQGSNSGTYVARNRGIAESVGEFITCQDSDDFSHPCRLELQATPLLNDARLQATRSFCLAVREDLQLRRRGYLPHRPNASSLLFRASAGRTLGGYLPARKGSDSEFEERIERRYGRPVLDIRTPLALVRILPDSLSRADFRSGWHHPARRAFTATYRHWHASATPTALELGGGKPTPISVPARLAAEPADPWALDHVFVSDWSLGYPRQVVFRALAQLLSDQGRSVGILHLDSMWYLRKRIGDVSWDLLDALAGDKIRRVMLDEEGSVEQLTVIDPTTMEFPPADRALFRSERAMLSTGSIVERSEGLPGEQRGASKDGVLKVFGPIDQDVKHVRGGASIGAFPASVWERLFALDRRRSVSTSGPVVGVELPVRHSEEATIRSLAKEIDASSLGGEFRLFGARAARVFEGARSFPPSSVYQVATDVDFRSFVSSVDFFLVVDGISVSEWAIELAIWSGALVVCVGDNVPLGDLAVHFTRGDLAVGLEKIWRNSGMQDRLRMEAKSKLRERLTPQGQWLPGRSS